MNTFIWCTYRIWSFHVLEGLLDLPDWKALMVITTPECQYDFSKIELAGIPILRVNPKEVFNASSPTMLKFRIAPPKAAFFYGWSWLVPESIREVSLCVTLHPGKLPKDRGGSPIQNQIRNGEIWTYANLIRLEDGLDEGPIYERQKISLEGDSVDIVWNRMTEAGISLSRNFLESLSCGTLIEKLQPNETPTFYKRVRPIDAELHPQRLSANQIYNIVRAHNESDPNSYVTPAFLKSDNFRIVTRRASLTSNGLSQVLWKNLCSLDPIRAKELIENSKNKGLEIVLPDQNGTPVYLTQIEWEGL